jgi:hypothetical protein
VVRASRAAAKSFIVSWSPGVRGAVVRGGRDSNCNRKNNGKGEILGALHCAADGEVVRCFGRDDVLVTLLTLLTKGRKT